jgi:hypothetical protein
MYNSSVLVPVVRQHGCFTMALTTYAVVALQAFSIYDLPSCLCAAAQIRRLFATLVTWSHPTACFDFLHFDIPCYAIVVFDSVRFVFVFERRPS